MYKQDFTQEELEQWGKEWDKWRKIVGDWIKETGKDIPITCEEVTNNDRRRN